MIIGRCHTNLDKFKSAKWPDKFVAVPRVGEKVQAEGRENLYVIRITHLIEKNIDYFGAQQSQTYSPIIEIELHSTKIS